MVLVCDAPTTQVPGTDSYQQKSIILILRIFENRGAMFHAVLGYPCVAVLGYGEYRANNNVFNTR